MSLLLRKKPALLSSCTLCLWKTGHELSLSLLYHGNSSSLRVNYFIREREKEGEENVDIVRAVAMNWRENIQNWSRDRHRRVSSRCADHRYLQIIGDQARRKQPTFAHFLWYPRRKCTVSSPEMVRNMCFHIKYSLSHLCPDQTRTIKSYFSETKLQSIIKDGLVKYCNIKTSRNGVSNMWILKNSRSLLSPIDQLDVRTATSLQTLTFRHFTS